MNEYSVGTRAVRFGAFELDLAAGELRKNGLRIRLQEQPFRLLAFLVERPGELVSREELREKLWASDTYVDFDNSLNTAASKLREALGDSASSPRFIETMPRRGYRFLASVEGVGPGIEPEGTNPTAETHTSPPAVPADSGAGPKSLIPRAAVLVGLLVCGLAIGAAVFRSNPSAPSANQPFRFSLPVEAPLLTPVISPDGQRIAYVAGDERSIWIQNLNDWEPHKVEGTEQSTLPFWSPDSASLAFGGPGTTSDLRRVGVDGEPPTTLCRLPGLFWGGTWSADGASIVFSAGEASRLYEVSALGGEPKPVLKDADEAELRFPHFLPLPAGVRALLCSTNVRSYSWIYLVNLESGEHTRLARGGLPVYSKSGHILYQTADQVNGVQAIPFSIESLQVTGEAFPIGSGAWEPSVSDSGSLAYRHVVERNVKLVWRDRTGKVADAGVTRVNILYPALSPDETQVALAATEDGNIDIWIHDFRRGVRTRVTTSPLGDFCPLWSSGGEQMVFSRGNQGDMDIFIASTDGAAEAKAVVATEWKEFATDWSGDGNLILYDRAHTDARNDVWYLERKGDTFEPRPFLESQFDQRAAQFSPDGKHVAYVSNKSGDYEVYVIDFPDGRREWKASEGGGGGPRWSKDGGELYFTDGSALLAVRVAREPAFALGSPEPLFEAHGIRGTYLPPYDVSPDGRFLVREPASNNLQSIRVVQNWFAEFKDRSRPEN